MRLGQKRQIVEENLRLSENEMVAEIVAIGDELCSGQRLDTNSQWLSLRLGELGILEAVQGLGAERRQQRRETRRW